MFLCAAAVHAVGFCVHAFCAFATQSTMLCEGVCRLHMFRASQVILQLILDRNAVHHM